MAKRSRRGSAAPRVIAALVLSVACNSLTGVNDLEVEDEYNLPGTGGSQVVSGAKGGSAQTGDPGPVAGSGGRAGSGGASGSGGLGGTAGADSTGGTAGSGSTAGAAGSGSLGGSGGVGGSTGVGGTAGSAGAGGAGGSGGSSDIASRVADLVDELAFQNEVVCDCFDSFGYSSRAECLSDFTSISAPCANTAFNLDPGVSSAYLACRNTAEFLYSDCTADLTCDDQAGIGGEDCYADYASATVDCPVLPSTVTRAYAQCTGVGGSGGCTDTCIYPNDGECDDGGLDSLTNYCAFGTDCADCGAR